MTNLLFSKTGIQRAFGPERCGKSNLHGSDVRMHESYPILEAVLDSIGSGIIVTDKHGKFVVWNPAATRMLGTQPDESGYSDWQNISGIYADDGTTELKAEESPFTRAIRGETIDSLRIYVHNEKMRRGLWLSLNIRPLMGASGEALGGVIVLTDITSQKLVEKELLRSNSDLQQFAALAAHDLQEPLRTVAGFLSLLMDRQGAQLDNKSRGYVDFIEDAVSRMQTLINDLLTYSRINSQTQKLEIVDCNDLLQDVIANLHATISESGAVINIEHLPRVHAEKSQLAQVFQNLIVNAIKFRKPDRQLNIDIRVQEKKAHFIFSVQDNGIGFESEHAHRVFDLFQRLHGRGEYEGSGIGLSVCKRIVERHGGSIFVESTPDEGSHFYFSIHREGDENGDQAHTAS